MLRIKIEETIKVIGYIMGKYFIFNNRLNDSRIASYLWSLPITNDKRPSKRGYNFTKKPTEFECEMLPGYRPV